MTEKNNNTALSQPADKKSVHGPAKRPITSGVIIWDKDVCTGCEICEMMCALYHDGVTGQAFSRLEVVEYHFAEHFELNACRQCLYPSCYYACPLKDKALCIDTDTGARYIDSEECVGCKSCLKACPFDPSRIKFNTEKKVSFKCDLCRERDEGPICVEYCLHDALKYNPRNEDDKKDG